MRWIYFVSSSPRAKNITPLGDWSAFSSLLSRLEADRSLLWCLHEWLGLHIPGQVEPTASLLANVSGSELLPSEKVLSSMPPCSSNSVWNRIIKSRGCATLILILILVSTDLQVYFKPAIYTLHEWHPSQSSSYHECQFGSQVALPGKSYLRPSFAATDSDKKLQCALTGLTDRFPCVKLYQHLLLKAGRVALLLLMFPMAVSVFELHPSSSNQRLYICSLSLSFFSLSVCAFVCGGLVGCAYSPQLAPCLRSEADQLMVKSIFPLLRSIPEP